MKHNSTGTPHCFYHSAFLCLQLSRPKYVISEEWTQCQECDFALSEERFFLEVGVSLFFPPAEFLLPVKMEEMENLKWILGDYRVL